MKKLVTLLLVLAGTQLIASTRLGAMDLDVTIQMLETYGFSEFKCECDHPSGEQATGHINTAGNYHYTFHLGKRDGQNFWMWWDTLQGKANVTVKADGAVVFQGLCTHRGEHEQTLPSTAAANATIVRSGAPRLEDNNERHLSYIRF